MEGDRREHGGLPRSCVRFCSLGAGYVGMFHQHLWCVQFSECRQFFDKTLKLKGRGLFSGTS